MYPLTPICPIFLIPPYQANEKITSFLPPTDTALTTPHGRYLYRNPTAPVDEQASRQLLWQHFQFCVLRHMRASGPPPSLEDFDDAFELTMPVGGEGKEAFESLMQQRLMGYEDDEIPRFQIMEV